MLCEKCKKNQATFFYEENINGSKRAYSLCPECANVLEKEGELSMGHDLFSLPSLGNLHDGLFGGLFGQATPIQKKTCPTCGASFADLRQNGKVGCPECYTVFAEELHDTIQSIHGNVKHVGRAPSRNRKDREKKDRLVELRNQMKAAIEEENFELAASLRDQIRSLESNN